MIEPVPKLLSIVIVCSTCPVLGAIFSRCPGLAWSPTQKLPAASTAMAFALAASADWVEVLDNPSQTTMETVTVDSTQGIALASLLGSLTSTTPTLATIADHVLYSTGALIDVFPTTVSI